MAKTLPILLLFGILAISALLDFPAGFYDGYDEPMGRGTRILGSVVAVGTGPFGQFGGAALFALIGLGLSLFVFVRDAKASAAAEPQSDPLLPTSVDAVRRRPLVRAADNGATQENNAPVVSAFAAGAAAAVAGLASGSKIKPATPSQSDELDMISAIIEANMPPPPSGEPLPPVLDNARKKTILFRQSLPGGPEDGLSYYGGKPFGPTDFVWPRGRGSEGPPLTFVMQWDCAQLAPLDATGLMPKDGVLYCFLNLDWGNHEDFIEGHHFVHHAGPTDGWAPVEPPEDLGPLFGKEGAWQIAYTTNNVDDADRYVPRLMPRFPFTPVAIDYPMPELDPEEADRLFWAEKWIADAQFAAQHPGAQDGPVRDIDAPHAEFGRPFAAFPHDFGAIRILAASMLKETRPGKRFNTYLFKDLSEEEKKAKLDAWYEEAKELYLFACSYPIGGKVPQDLADQVWEWQDERKDFIRLGFDKTVETCVDLSLGVSSEGLSSVPQEWVDKAMERHVFASDYMHDEYHDAAKHGTRDDWMKMKEAGKLERVRTIHAPTPNHMFGPPSFVQGYVEEYLDTHVLLLELTGYDGPEHHFGEGVLQYLITPEDLEAGRFDKVVSVLSGY
ncbi:DUF1963 domain-containing protein [Qipengyuania sp. DSG2-2]|uniref:DUF1963 domain-containing protein n=1 Tax=Qipengyuania sp. DGS2-2 TaxID=3349631 RepID=UPI0036D2FA74